MSTTLSVHVESVTIVHCMEKVLQLFTAWRKCYNYSLHVQSVTIIHCTKHVPRTAAAPLLTLRQIHAKIIFLHKLSNTSLYTAHARTSQFISRQNCNDNPQRGVSRTGIEIEQSLRVTRDKRHKQASVKQRLHCVTMGFTCALSLHTDTIRTRPWCAFSSATRWIWDGIKTCVCVCVCVCVRVRVCVCVRARVCATNKPTHLHPQLALPPLSLRLTRKLHVHLTLAGIHNNVLALQLNLGYFSVEYLAAGHLGIAVEVAHEVGVLGVKVVV